MQELFRRYLDNQCSPEEVKELLAYFHNPDDETQLRGLIFDSLDEIDEEDDGSGWQAETNRLLTQVKKQLNTEKGRVVPFSKKKWLRIAAAAVLVTGVFAVYNYMRNDAVHKPTVAETATNPADPIAPGRNKATLTLDNESTINLETALNNTLAEQGNTSVVKSADGQVIYKLINEKPISTLYNRIITPRGGQFQVTLSDGTNVWLNAASSIHFPVTFTGSERRVEITGEAYFEVAKNAAMPFKVKIADKAEVEVLGTHFNINAYSDEPTVNTTLLEGSVKFISLAQKNSRILVPGEQAVLNAADQIQVKKDLNAEQAIAWKNGTFEFSDSNLATVLRELARWYDVDIIFEGAAPQKQFTGEIQRNLNLSQVLKLLEKNGVHGRIEGKKLIVTT